MPDRLRRIARTRRAFRDLRDLFTAVNAAAGLFDKARRWLEGWDWFS